MTTSGEVVTSEATEISDDIAVEPAEKIQKLNE